MLAFAHFFIGTLGYFFIKAERRNMFAWLSAGFLGMLPDIDMVLGKLFPKLIWLQHRNFTHSLLFAIIIGIFTAIYFKSFLFGVFPIVLHAVADLIDQGTVAFIWFNTRWDWNFLNIPAGIDGGSSYMGVMISTIVGSCILLFWLIYFYRKEKWQEIQALKRIMRL